MHLVFQQADVETLHNAIALDESLQGEIIEIKDDFAVGPIDNILNDEGYMNRLEWWKEILRYSTYAENLGSFDDRKTVQHIKEKLAENENRKIVDMDGAEPT